MENKHALLKKYLDNTHIKIITAHYAKTPLNWGSKNEVPDYSKFYLIEDGEGFIKTDSNIIYPKKGDLIYIKKGMAHSFGTISKNTLVKHWCHADIMIGATDISDILSLPIHISLNDYTAMLRAFKQLIKVHKKQSSTSVLEEKASMFRILSMFIQESIQNNSFSLKTNPQTDFSYIIKYIENHLSQKIVLKELSDMCHIAPNYFIKLFKAQFGVSPMRYIANWRIQHAKTLLIDTSMSIGDIANEIGIQNIYYFSNFFKKTTGLSPSDFRKLEN